MTEPIVKSPQFYKDIFKSNYYKEQEENVIVTTNMWLTEIHKKLKQVASLDGIGIILRFGYSQGHTAPINVPLLIDKLAISGWHCYNIHFYKLPSGKDDYSQIKSLSLDTLNPL